MEAYMLDHLFYTGVGFVVDLEDEIEFLEKDSRPFTQKVVDWLKKRLEVHGNCVPRIYCKGRNFKSNDKWIHPSEILRHLATCEDPYWKKDRKVILAAQCK
jgi:hypothetical protein